MAKGSTYMRGLCIAFNILIGIFGVILHLFGIIINSVKVEVDGSVSFAAKICIGFGLVTVLLSLLGVYGAYREKSLFLILYSVLMSIEFTIVMVVAIITTLARPQNYDPILQKYGNYGIRIVLGIFFTLATVMVAAVVGSLVLWYKIQKQSTATVIESDSSRVKYQLRPENTL